MKAIHSKVNIVPVIAKADTLTLRERDRLKRRVSVKQRLQCLLWTSDVFLLSTIVVRGCLINSYSHQKVVITILVANVLYPQMFQSKFYIFFFLCLILREYLNGLLNLIRLIKTSHLMMSPQGPGTF